MQGILETARSAFTLFLVLLIGWGIVFLAGFLVERKLRRGSSGQNIWDSMGWVWDNANVIGIPTLVIGAVYMVWALNTGYGIAGPGLLVLLLMGAATLLIGFAPTMRRR
jgi:hypothetical protein